MKLSQHSKKEGGSNYLGYNSIPRLARRITNGKRAAHWQLVSMAITRGFLEIQEMGLKLMRKMISRQKIIMAEISKICSQVTSEKCDLSQITQLLKQTPP